MSEPLRPQPGYRGVWRHGALPCRMCGHQLDAARPAPGGPAVAPADGDWSLCIECGEVSLFVVGPLGVALREPTTGELARFARSPYAKVARDVRGRGQR